MRKIEITHPSKELNGAIQLDGSKSISNRVLLIRALSGYQFGISNLSTSDDTRTMEALLSETHKVYDSHHAGTTFRFLTAYLSTQKGTQILTGSARMKERPIGPLVEALRSIGANISYIENEGYPPLEIGEMNYRQDKIYINSGMSSQYISSLMMIAPTLPNGLTIVLEGDTVSESYLLLTMRIMEFFGIFIRYKDNIIQIDRQNYQNKDFVVEADWSAASYYYALMSLCTAGEIQLLGLRQDSFQGDSAMEEIGVSLGVTSVWGNQNLTLVKKDVHKTLDYNFINCPDIAQTVAVICSAKGIENNMTGLQTLKIKETDRVSALDQELSKVGGGFSLVANGTYTAKSTAKSWAHDPPTFSTYQDHRMAMSFAPLALIDRVMMEEPEVVSKSYPNFWKDIEQLGFEIKEISS